MPIPRRSAPASHGQSSTTGGPSLVETQYHQTSHREHRFNSWYPAWVQLRTRSAMPCPCNGQLSRSIGQHRYSRSPWRQAGKRNGGNTKCQPFPPRQDGQRRHSASKAGNRGPPGSPPRRTSVTQRYGFSWTHTWQSTTTTSTYWKSLQRQTSVSLICRHFRITRPQREAHASAGTPYWDGASKDGNAGTARGTSERPT
jgi:hypothetical protein